MKVLVTGASGFFGASLVPALVEANHSVITFGRSAQIERLAKLTVEHRRGDLADKPSLQAALSEIDIVIHMAGMVSYRLQDRSELFRSNVDGTRNIIDEAAKGGVKRFIHMSSIAGMGIPEPGQLGDEKITYNLAGRNLHYCDSKHESELVVNQFSQGIETITLAPGITFGEGDTHPHHQAIFQSMQRGGRLGYPIGGVMFSDIQDVVRTTINALSMGRPGERYVVGSANLTFRQASIVLSQVIGGKQPVIPIPGLLSEAAGLCAETFLPMFGKVPQLTWQIAWLSQRQIFFSSAKAQRELSHQCTNFEQTIRRTAPFYLKTSR